MSLHDFSPGTKFNLNGTSYKVQARFYENLDKEYEEEEPKPDIQIEDLSSGRIVPTFTDELLMAWKNNRLFFEVVGKGAAPANAGEDFSIHHQFIAPDDCKPRDWKKAVLRFRLILPLLTIKRTDKAIIDRLKEIEVLAEKNARGEETKEKWTKDELEFLDKRSLRSVRRWVADFIEAKGDVWALIDNYHNCGGHNTIHPRVEELIEEARKNLSPQSPSTAVAEEQERLVQIENEKNSLSNQEEHNNEINSELKSASPTTVWRRVAKPLADEKKKQRLGVSRYAKSLLQEGKFNTFKYPKQRTEYDGTKTDLIVVDDDGIPIGRLTLIVAIDVKTRVITGYYMGFEPESWLSVSECLYNEIRVKDSPMKIWGTENEILKNYGVPMSGGHDRGKGFKNASMLDSLITLKTRLDTQSVLNGEGKAHVEAFLDTISSDLWHVQIGTTLGNYLELGRYDARMAACAYLRQVDQAFNIWIHDWYHQHPHSGLLNAKPGEVWHDFLSAHWEPKLPPSNLELSILLGRVMYCALDEKGISFLYLKFNNNTADLASFREKIQYLAKQSENRPLDDRFDEAGRALPPHYVKVKYHPGDLSCMWIYDYIHKKWLTVYCTYPEYARHLSLWQHQIVIEVTKKEFGKVDRANLGRARHRVKETFLASAPSAEKFRFDTGGRRSSEYANKGGEPGLVRPSDLDNLPEAQPILEVLSDEELANVLVANQNAAQNWHSSTES